ncbi:hypothetical protein [Tepidiforma thermophila]|uniref:Uncharacterized protein n=1 Tax=Tepidiforma thermophila (strain KCTC 52669 / CGMCC 1.13589 / G233) TaxID=2761530 RepID=A0A2A9HDW2_TEPT2|nr:hypothetical protein [Tepidiforma thermophila]PFG72989.1 hypothetical protein A9A59_0182 [Tepidiforma thermophila]
MDIKFNEDEVNELLTVIVNRIADEAGLSDRDRAMLKNWRSKQMRPGRDDMTELVQKVNEDFAQQMARRQRSQIRKPDWLE